MKNNSKSKDFIQINSDISFLIRNRQYSKALAIIEERLLTDYDPYLLVFKAHILLVSSNNNEEKNCEAEELLNTVLSYPSISFPTKKYALSELGRLASMRNDQVRSLDFYNQILEESNYVEPSIRCKIANIYSELEMYSRALEVLDVKGFNNEALNNARCRVLIQQKKYKEALDALKQPINTSSYPRDAYDINKVKVENEKNYYLGCIYHSYYYDFDSAIKYFQNGIKDNNKYDMVYWPCITGLISVYYTNMQYDKCIDLCNQFLAEAPKGLKSYQRIIKSLVRVYIEKRDFDKALEIAKKYQIPELELFVNACLKMTNNDFISAYELFDQIYTRDEGLEIEVLFRQLVILFRLKRIDEFNKLYNEFVVMSSRSKHMNIEAKSMKMSLSSEKVLNNELDNYYGRQILNYNKEEYRNYIKSNFVYKFNKDIDMDELMDNVKKQIEVMNPLCVGFYDLYVIPYRNIGVTKDGKSVHNLLVRCLPDTKNIVLILPNDYEKEENEIIESSSKQKRLSQIDKFKQRYGNI